MKGLLLLLAAAIFTGNETAPILVKNSGSPDGKFQIFVVPTPDDSNGAKAQLKICRISDEVPVAAFDYYQWGALPPVYATILWKPDGRAVAVTTDSSKNSASSSILVNSGARWVDVSDQMVNSRFAAKYSEREGWQSHGHCESIVKNWSNGEIKMSWYEDFYRWNKDGTLDTADPLFVYYRLRFKAAKPVLEFLRVEKDLSGK